MRIASKAYWPIWVLIALVYFYPGIRLLAHNLDFFPFVKSDSEVEVELSGNWYPEEGGGLFLKYFNKKSQLYSAGDMYFKYNFLAPLWPKYFISINYISEEVDSRFIEAGNFEFLDESKWGKVYREVSSGGVRHLYYIPKHKITIFTNYLELDLVKEITYIGKAR